MTIPRHWIISGLIAAPGAVLFRAVQSEWITVESVVLRYALLGLGLTMALGGVVLFIFMANDNAMRKKDK